MNSVFGTLKPLQLLSVIVSPPAIALQKVLNQCADTLGAQHQHINISTYQHINISTYQHINLTPGPLDCNLVQSESDALPEAFGQLQFDDYFTGNVMVG